MINRIDIETYLNGERLLPIIDVRTPAEYSTGHIPGAVNIPLFSNEERAKVGTAYKQVSPEKAYELGYRFVEPKLEYFIEESRNVSQDGKVAVYCWRGGMRSKSFAEHIEANGIQEVNVIEGGYKAFRQHALDAFSQPEQLRILGGYTGSGKTRILKQLERLGEQVINLEGIANHKGSAFGAIGQQEQPQNEHFTNLLFWEWRKLDMSRPVWLEDESIHIGRVFIPENLFHRMREAITYFLDIPTEVRGHLLVEEYKGSSKEPLEEAIHKISRRLGGQNTKMALEALSQNDYHQAAVITLYYYDKYYLKGLNRRDNRKVVRILSDTVDAELNAAKLLDALTVSR